MVGPLAADALPAAAAHSRPTARPNSFLFISFTPQSGIDRRNHQTTKQVYQHHRRPNVTRFGQKAASRRYRHVYAGSVFLHKRKTPGKRTPMVDHFARALLALLTVVSFPASATDSIHWLRSDSEAFAQAREQH